jgi:tRNA(adenine34) deaminase
MSSPPTEELQARAMERALELARLGAEREEVPVGAVVLGPDGAVLGEAHNEIEALHDPTAHAELLALRRACAAVAGPRLPEGSLLVATLEPCAMCAGAIVLARPTFLLFGALDPKSGACGSLRDLVRDPRLNHRVLLLARRREADCGELLTRFFRARRG